MIIKIFLLVLTSILTILSMIKIKINEKRKFFIIVVLGSIIFILQFITLFIDENQYKENINTLITYNTKINWNNSEIWLRTPQNLSNTNEFQLCLKMIPFKNKGFSKKQYLIMKKKFY